MCDKQILVLCDNDTCRLDLMARMNSRFSRLECFGDDLEILEWCRQHMETPPAAVIVHATSEAGYQTAAQIKEILPDIIILVITNGRKMTEGLKSLAAGAKDFVARNDPNFIVELGNALEYWIEEFMPRSDDLTARVAG